MSSELNLRHSAGSAVRTPRPFNNAVLTAASGFVLWESIWLLSGGFGFAHSWDIVVNLGFLFLTTGFWLSVTSTILLTAVGLLAGSIIALIVGSLLASRDFIERSSRGTVFFIRSIPSVALIPLFLAAIGSRTTLIVGLLVWLVATKMVIFVLRGLRELPSALNDQSDLLRLGPIRRLIWVRFPAASGLLTTGLRLTVNRAYGGVVLAGLIAGTPGIGRDIQLARLNADSELVLSYTVIAAMVGVLFFWLFKKAEERTVRWRGVR